MSGGAPIPVPTKEVILSIDDLKEAADKNLTKVVKGKIETESELCRYAHLSRVL